MNEQCLHAKDEMNRLLDNFETITLEEMNNVKLMDRVETKYVMSSAQLVLALRALSQYYRLLTVGNNRKCQYQTHYFDTPNLDMYRMHHNGMVNRYKIRVREYVDSGLSFTEIKFKDNKKKVFKKRIEIERTGSGSHSGSDSGSDAGRDMLDDVSRKFINDESAFDSGELVPVLKNRYCRLTFVHKVNVERVTVDFDLKFFGRNGESVSMDNLVIAEVKQGQSSQKSDFVRLMQEIGVRTRTFSKYCMGVSFLYEGVKKNNFKENMIFVNKIKGGMV